MDIVNQGKALMLALGASKIMYLMLTLSIISLALILERAWFFFRHSENLEGLARRLDASLEAGDVDGAISQ